MLAKLCRHRDRYQETNTAPYSRPSSGPNTFAQGRANHQWGSSASRASRVSETPTLVGSGSVSQRATRKTKNISSSQMADDEVLDFLTSMDQSFACLLERFQLAGLTSKARLQLMARWTPREIDEFLHGTLWLSAFERKVLHIRTVLPNELDLTRTWKKQAVGATDRFLVKMLEAFPTFKKYVKAWPLLYYSYQSLGYLRKRPEFQAQRRWSRYFASAGVPAPQRMLRPPHEHTQVVQGQAGIMPPAPSPNLVIPCLANNVSSPFPIFPPPEPAMNIADTLNEGPNLLDCGGSATQGSGTVVNEGVPYQVASGEQEIVRFLIAVDQTFAYLLDRFRLAGLTSNARLQTLAHWPPAEIEEFLRSKLQLSAYEHKMMSDALAQMIQL
ncbi:hypothetical protein ACG7TL_003523 [Trametes sanguinea]